MEIKVKDIYTAALAIMHEKATEDYAQRVCPIINTLIGQSWHNSEMHDGGPHSHWQSISSLEDTLSGIDISIALSAMPYGLAAMLYLDEDPVRAGSWWDVWQEAVRDFKRSRPAEFEDIDNLYGGFGI